MYYFVSAWYGNSRPWQAPHRVDLEFDDTVNQLRIFNEAGEKAQLIVNTYSPQLRHLLHRQDLLNVLTWSLFDEIQGIQDLPTQKILDIKDFTWPEGTEFIYTPFRIVAYVAGELYAHIVFNEASKIASIELKQKEQKHYIFDDRGFLSSILYFNIWDQPYYQEYLGFNGEWRMREYLLEENKRVVLNPQYPLILGKEEYDSMDELISEMIRYQLEKVSPDDDQVVIAAHPQHNQLYLDQMQGRELAFSYFSSRYSIKAEINLNHITQAKVIVVDTPEDKDWLVGQVENQTSRIIHLPPIDTRLQLGTSQRYKQSKICLLVDNLSQAEVEKYLKYFGDLMAENDRIDLLLVSRKSVNLDQLKEWFSDYLDSLPVDFEVDEDNLLDENGDEITWYSDRIDYLSVWNENGLIQALESVRLIVDLQAQPDIFVQIAGISAGIPQINLQASPYVRHKENGYIIEHFDNLGSGLDYYLVGLKNWNQSLVYSVNLILNYTGDRLVAKWQGVSGD